MNRTKQKYAMWNQMDSILDKNRGKRYFESMFCLPMVKRDMAKQMRGLKDLEDWCSARDLKPKMLPRERVIYCDGHVINNDTLSLVVIMFSPKRKLATV